MLNLANKTYHKALNNKYPLRSEPIKVTFNRRVYRGFTQLVLRSFQHREIRKLIQYFYSITVLHIIIYIEY